jgi:hypothetical protein
MNDFTKFLSVKNQLQKFYNFRAKEEREIIYATKIFIDNSYNTESDAKTVFSGGNTHRDTVIIDHSILATERGMKINEEKEKTNNSSGSPNDLIAITHLKDTYYIEFLRLDKDISFKFSSSFNMLIKLTVKNLEELSLKIGEREFDIIFFNEVNLKEFVWCLIKIISLKKLENQVQIKGINYKDLEDFAVKNNFYSFNKKFEEEKKKERYEIDVSDKELEDLEYTLKSLKIDSIISYDLENLNSKIEQFNINTKESFLQKLQGDFAKDVTFFLAEIQNLDGNISKMSTSLESDLSSIADIWHGIQKIEDANHRIELRNENKRRLQEFMTKLIDQLTISRSKKENLIHSHYLSNSELVIISEILDNFVKFYKSRKKQDIKMSIIREGHEEIKSIIKFMIDNFNIKMHEYIRNHIFNETYLLRNLPSFNNTKIILQIKDIVEKLKKGRGYLENFLLDRRFFIEKLNILVNNQEDLDKSKIFKDCTTIMAKGMRDCLAMEFNGAIKILQIFFDCEILNPQKLDIYLSSEDLMKYDAFERIETDYVYEINKYMSTFILNSFFAADKCVEILLNVFSEEPNFHLDKTSKYYEEIEKIVTYKLYEYLSKNFNTSVEKNVLLGFVIYSILSAVQERISKNIIEDMIILSVKDIFDHSYKMEESYMNSKVDSSDLDQLNMNNVQHVNMEEVGIRKISLQETKNLIVRNMKTLQGLINVFFNEQKEIIGEYTCEVRRVGVIPIVKKTLNFIKLLIALTRGIKQDYLYETINDFRAKLKVTIERLAKTKPKYTNIILLENYYYINICLRSLENFDISNPNLSKIEQDAFIIFAKFKADYIKEIFEYQFKEFNAYYEKFTSQYTTFGDQVRMQTGFSYPTFEKNAIGFLKELPKAVEKMAKRVNKHLCKELDLAPIIWIDIQNYLMKITTNIETACKDCYSKPIDSKLILNATESVKNFNFMNLYKAK